MASYVSALIPQNHKIAETGRHFWKSSSPSPLIKQGQLELFTGGYIQSGLECFQRWMLHCLSGKYAPVLDHSHSKTAISCA